VRQLQPAARSRPDVPALQGAVLDAAAQGQQVRPVSDHAAATAQAGRTVAVKWAARLVLLALALVALYFLFAVPVHVENPIWPLGHRASIGVVCCVLVGWMSLVLGAICGVAYLVHKARLQELLR
jgi:predicted RND superfamily exporter protein